MYEAALAKAGWNFGHKKEDQRLRHAYYDKNGRNIYLYERACDEVAFTLLERESLFDDVCNKNGGRK